MIKEKAKKIYVGLSVNKWPHVKRVLAFTILISEKLKLDKKEREILKISALLHDIGYQKQFKVGGKDVHERYSCEMLDKFLKNTYSEEEVDKIKGIISTHSCFENCKTLQQKILFDADKLDKTTFGEIIRKSIIFHGKYKMNDLQIFEKFIERFKNQKFHLEESKEIATKNLEKLKPVFEDYSKFLNFVNKKEEEVNI